MTLTRKPEVLAPAGDLESLDAALCNGADAVYFGLDEGFNARARAQNFSRDNLAETVGRIHIAGARAYVTMNTLIFQRELGHAAEIIRDLALGGVDALIVQDPAVAIIARALCPALEVHASTQMTISSPDGATFAQTLGVTRVVVPRELSVDEIRTFAQATPLELEVFIHGALCMSYSGQCLTSEAWGGRSANRGQCAQSCRMPYKLVIDGQERAFEDVNYFLSPKDLAGLTAVEELSKIGVHGLKIEGRQKSATYVATATAGYRRWVDAVARGPQDEDRQTVADDLRAMSLAYTRGFSPGFLGGTDHQRLVEGRFPKHRGILLGVVVDVGARHVDVASGARVSKTGTPGRRPGGETALEPVEASAIDVRAGLGVVFDDGRPDLSETGGPIFEVKRLDDGFQLTFGRPGPDLSRVRAGQRVWISGDPALVRATERQLDLGPPSGRIPLSLKVSGRLGGRMKVIAEARHATSVFESDEALQTAAQGGLDTALLIEKLGAFGGTPFHLASLDCDDLQAGLYLPVSSLKVLRRRLVDDLLPSIETGPARVVAGLDVLSGLQPAVQIRQADRVDLSTNPARLVPLCRTEAQLDAALEFELPEIELDFMEFVGLAQAVERVRTAGRKVTIATVRIQKPGEEGYDRRIAQLRPDGVLVRHWGALMCFSRLPVETRPELHGDFSLNVTNALTFQHLISLGLDTVTASHDLDEHQLAELTSALPAEQRPRLAVTVHHHIPTFHTEHCVYAHTLSEGRDFRTCGRPCEVHRLALRDHTKREHPVVVDVSCRNTVFNAEAQSAAHLTPKLVAQGHRRLRVEFVWETREQTRTLLEAWTALLAGELHPQELLRRTGHHEQFGVNAGTMRVLA